MLVLGTWYQRVQMADQLRQVLSDGLPDKFSIDVAVVMRQDVALADYLAPRYFRVCLPETSDIRLAASTMISSSLSIIN